MKYTILTNENIKINKEYKKLLISILKNHQYVKKDYEYVFIIGGDGTFLSFVTDLLDKDVRVVFINSGKLGFYSYIDNPNKLLESEILSEKYYISVDTLKVVYKNKSYQCINDFAYHSNYTASIKTYINSHNLQNFYGNGVLISTPFGSTARNKSLNGAILLPNTGVLTMVEVEPINNKYYSSFSSPIIFKNDKEIKIECENYNKWWLLFDGRQLEFTDKKAIIHVSCQKSKCKVLIKIDDANWIKKLNYAFIKEEVCKK